MAGLYYAVQQMGREADIWIFGDITRYPMDDSDMSAGRLVDKIAELEADALNVHIDSYGGSVSEGWAIYNASCGSLEGGSRPMAMGSSRRRRSILSGRRRTVCLYAIGLLSPRGHDLWRRIRG